MNLFDSDRSSVFAHASREVLSLSSPSWNSKRGGWNRVSGSFVALMLMAMLPLCFADKASGGEKEKEKVTFSASQSANLPQDNVVIAQPKVKWDSEHSVNASMSVHWVGSSVLNLGQTFTALSPFKLHSLTLEIGEVKSSAVTDHPYAICLFHFSDKESAKPASLMWTATGKLPDGIYADFTADNEKKYLTFTLPETKLEAGQVYGLVLYSMEDAGKDNWRDLISFHNTWGSFYEGGQLITGKFTAPGDLDGSKWKGSSNDLTFWIQGE